MPTVNPNYRTDTHTISGTRRDRYGELLCLFCSVRWLAAMRRGRAHALQRVGAGARLLARDIAFSPSYHKKSVTYAGVVAVCPKLGSGMPATMTRCELGSIAAAMRRHGGRVELAA